ncbi:hypothetical protein [Acinetobacter sp. CFCC 10889]|uniref:hypothetical protein n=1 Tax=Acinetobacter sp. CFCC 10889 TaxID=1775557 RepID=UPI001BC884A4|nr:hypothetical protein [Acinetobacter sp. CFCC 10889]
MKLSSFIKLTLLNITLISSFTLYANPVNSYKGIPKQDPQFAQFLQNNKNKVVLLDLTIKNPNEFDDITSGYRGVSPTFYVAPMGKQDFEVFIECDKIDNPNAEDTIGKCSPYVTWNKKTGNLKGKFTIKDQGKNKMGSRLFYIVAEKSSQMTVVVKEHLGMSESGDGYAFTTKDGHEFFVYNAGGAISLKGESNIIENATICLKLKPQDGTISSISKGKCQ